MKRTVFLLGAGAALNWGGPSTKNITNYLKENGPKNKCGKYITEVIFEKFAEDDGLNFEGLIDIIEHCFQYWSNSNEPPLTIGNLLIDKNHEFWSDVINLEYLHSQEARAVHSIENNPKLTDEAKFFALLLVNIFNGINEQIRNYGQYNAMTNKFSVKKNTEINDAACTYFQTVAKTSYLRIYSLNYDRLVQFLFKEIGLDAFQGFSPDTLVPDKYNDKYEVDTKRILKTFDEHCIYHLHGNYAWHVKNKNINGLNGYSIYNGYLGTINTNDQFAVFQSEKNKPLFLSNIITGYSKVQRTNLTPFKQMASAFDIDCHTADEIIIVGYSFGDEHINDTIRQAKKANPNCKITIITRPKKDDVKENFKKDFVSSFISDWARYNQAIFKNTKISSYSDQYKSEIIFKDFKDYLLDCI